MYLFTFHHDAWVCTGGSGIYLLFIMMHGSVQEVQVLFLYVKQMRI